MLFRAMSPFAGKLDQGEQHENERCILDEVGMGAHAPSQQIAAAIADLHVTLEPHADNPQRQPQVDRAQRRSRA